MKRIAIPVLLAVVVLMSACGVIEIGDRNNPVDVSYALERIERFNGKEIYISCYPIAYHVSVSFTGAKSFLVFFSDSASDFCGELASIEDAQDSWLEALVHEDDALWKGVETVFKSGNKPERLVLVFRGVKDSTFGYYYDYVGWYS